MTAETVEVTRSILACAARSLPSPLVVRDLLSVGVCIRCIFRLSGVHGHAYSCSSISATVLLSFLEEQKSPQHEIEESVYNSNGLVPCSKAAQGSEYKPYCSICLGILQLAYQDNEEMKTSKEEASISDFTTTISELVKAEYYQIDNFSIEVSIPPVLIANERAIRLYLKRKYDSEEWFREKFMSKEISVKDALKLAITSSLEHNLNAKSGANSFRIRLTYTHSESSEKLRSFLDKDNGSKKMRKEKEHYGDIDNVCKGNTKDPDEQISGETDAGICRGLNGLQDNDFCEHFVVPPEKAYRPCHLSTTLYRIPIYIGGRYLKFSRKVSQSRWIIDDERMGEASVEEIIGSKALLICQGDNYKFHAAGREDIDVRMLGSGRPFLVEISNARQIPSLVDIQQIAEAINNSGSNYVNVRNLRLVGNEAWTLMREGEAEKQKQYAALVWISRPLTTEDLKKISSIKDMEIMQNTPVRVLHRRSPLERKRIIHWMMVEEIAGSCQYFLLQLCTQAGTYIKEFVHGDLGRTHPSIGSILGCRAEILQLDVTDVKMDCFD